MAIIPDFFMDSVVALGAKTANSEMCWIATGFIVGRKEANNPSLSTHYLITNKHVVSKTGRIYIRFNSLGDSFVRDYPLNLYDSSGNPVYSVHPNASSDVVAIQINPQTLINDHSIWGSFDLDDHTLTLEQMEATGVQEGSLIYVLGFPMGEVQRIKAPICRLGCISRVKDAFIMNRDTPTFMIDAQVFPGNSGGPVISRPELVHISGTPFNDKSNLIGIVSSYLPYRETLISLQTGKECMIQEENSGLAIVHPVDRIKEVVEIEWKKYTTEVS